MRQSLLRNAIVSSLRTLSCLVERNHPVGHAHEMHMKEVDVLLSKRKELPTQFTPVDTKSTAEPLLRDE